MAFEALDVVGYAVMNPGSAAAPADQAFLPLLDGSRYVADPALDPIICAMGLAEAQTFSQGVTKPALLARTYLFTGTNRWFNAVRLTGAFRPAAATGIIGDYVTVGNAGMGAIQYALADAGDGAPVNFTKSKWGSMQLQWGAEGPILATILIYLYGALGTNVAWTGVGGINTTASPPTGPPLLAQSLTYGATLTDVRGGSVTITNNMQPDLTTPLAVTPAAQTGLAYPNNYWNQGPPQVTLTLDQKKGAVTILDPADNIQANAITIVFTGIPPTPPTVTFTANTLKPVVEKTTSLGLATVRRTYRNISSGVSAAAAFTFT